MAAPLLLLSVEPGQVRVLAAWEQSMGTVWGEAALQSAAFPTLEHVVRSPSGRSIVVTLSVGDTDGFEDHVIALQPAQ